MKKLVKNPGLEETKELLEEYLPRDFYIQLNGLCSVKYKGRAKSKLDKGERIVIKKEDSAFLVHGPDNYQPKNWQPDVDSFKVNIIEDNLEIIANRRKPREKVNVVFEEIDFILVDKLVDRSDIEIKGHEIDIHDWLENNPAEIENDLKIVERERETPAGFIDLLCRDKNKNLLVIEVKRNPDFNTVLQLKRYIEEIDKEYSADVRGMIIAPDISSNLIEYLEKRDLEFMEVEMSDVISSYEEFDDSQKGLSDF